jgi:hypothetical protein
MRLLAVVEAFGVALGSLAVRWRSMRPNLLLGSTSLAVSALLMVEIGPSAWWTQPPASRNTRMDAVEHVRATSRSSRRAVDGDMHGRGTVTGPRDGRLTLSTPVHPRVSEPTPGHPNIKAGIKDAPDDAPLWCLSAEPIVVPFCVDYPVRP